MSGEIDSEKIHNQQNPQIFIKLSCRELCDSKLTGLYTFDKMVIMSSLSVECKHIG